MNSKRKAESDSNIPSKCRKVEEVLTRGNNSLSQLNELGIKGLEWEMKQINNKFPQRFRCKCLFTEAYSGISGVIPAGTSFASEASNKSNCRHLVADQIMDRLSGKVKLNLSPGTVTNPFSNKIIVSKPVDKVSSGLITIDDAVRILNEKMPDIDYKYNAIDSGFCCYVSYRGFMIKGTGASKKVAKRSVAVQILQKHFKYVFPEEVIPAAPIIETPVVMEVEKLPLNRRKNFSNQIQLMIKKEFERRVTNLEVQYSKRKVLAGIIISRKLKVVFPNYYREQEESLNPNIIDPMLFFMSTGWTINPDDCGEILKLITFSTGTKCLSGNDINIMGSAVNDCHAEVISKRALQLFLLRTIERLKQNVQLDVLDDLYGTDILELHDQDCPFTYKVKDDVKFHLYISSSPCGDSRIFYQQSAVPATIDESDDENEEDSHPNRKNRGVLRTKIECGEGTIPIKTRHIQTWDGILGGERLLTMSCSDKVCLWNVVGLQGALLSNMLSHPVYLDSITIGSLFQLDHSLRALYERAKAVTGESDWLEAGASDTTNGDDREDSGLEISADNVDQFRVNNAWLLTVTDQEERAPSKSSNYCANWILGENLLEIIATSKGLCIDNAPSRLAKNCLFKSFLAVFQWAKVAGLGAGNGQARYDETKTLSHCPDRAIGAANYQRKKVALFKYLHRMNLGRWICKPLEQDWFSIPVPQY